MRELWGAALIAAALVSCSKKTIAEEDEAPLEATTATPPPIEIVTYASMTEAIGARTLLEPFVVHQAASNDAAIVAHLSTGTSISLRSAYQGWLMIEWASGFDARSIGWIEAKPDDARFGATETDASAPPMPTASAKAKPKKIR